MVDVKLLSEKYGLTQEYLRKALGGDLETGAGPDISAEDHQKHLLLQRRIKARIDEGINRCFTYYKTFLALDMAWDTPWRQISATLVQSLVDKDMTKAAGQQEVTDSLTSWGLTHMLSDERDPKTNAPTGKKVLNLPVFNTVFVPLVKAYTTIRWAKICNDRRLTPFHKYEPAKQVTELKVKCAALTDRVQRMSIDFAYFETMRQAVLKDLHYGVCMQFIKEEWYVEEQEQKQADGTTKLVKVKEGLRYHHPHPSRTYRDIAHPRYTYNTDIGAEYAGYWRLVRYGDIVNNENFYFTDKIKIDANNMLDRNRTFFNTVYPCTMSYPTVGMNSGGVGQMDAENQMGDQYYNVNYNDQAVLLTEHFDKINPAEFGLGGGESGYYSHPVWFRFVIAGNNGNVIYAAPLPSCPISYIGYDSDESKAQNSSLSLETLPFQNQVENMLTQLLLTMKQNLANLIMVDTDQIKDEKIVERIQNAGERFFRTLNIFKFSGINRRAGMTGQSPDAIFTAKLPYSDTNQIIQTIKVVLDLLERTLVMSSQEVAQAASHEQTREEIKNINNTSSARQQFTATPVDEYRDSWKYQIYCYLMAYGDPEFWAHIPCDKTVSREDLEKWGFTYNPDDHHGEDKVLRGKMKMPTAMDLYEFASTRDGEDRTNDPAIAQAMSQFVQGLMANPMTAQAIGPTQAIALANVIAQYAGLPKDFRLRSLMKDGDLTHEQQQAQGQQQHEQQMAKMQQQHTNNQGELAKQILQTTLQQVQALFQKEVKPIADEAVKLDAGLQQQAQAIAKIEQILSTLTPNPQNENAGVQSTAPAGG